MEQLAVLALDGLDELPRARTEACVAALNDFLAETGTPVLLTCRTEALAGLSSPANEAVRAALRPWHWEHWEVEREDDSVRRVCWLRAPSRADSQGDQVCAIPQRRGERAA